MLNLIHTRMSVGARLGLIAALLLIPIGMLTWLFVAQSAKEMTFATRERAGVAYIQAAWPLFEADGGSTAEFDAARARFDPMFGTAAQSEAFINATEPAARRAAGSAFLVAVADASYLTLDPDLDSYYVMDLVVLRLPAIHDAIGLLGSAVAMTGEGRSAAIAVAEDRIGIGAAAAKASVSAALKANAEGATEAAVGEASTATQAAIATVLAQAKTAAAGAQLDEGPFDTQANRLWPAAIAELDRLLAARIAAQQARLQFWLCAVAVVLAIAGLLMFLISRAMSGRISALVDAMGKLANEDVAVVIPCQQDRNETGRIAHALMIFKDSLIERLRLRGESADAHQKMTDLARALEEKHQQATEELELVVAYVKEGMLKLHDGDFTYRLKELFPIDYKAIRMDFNQTAHQLESALITIREGAESMRGSSEEISTASDDLSRRTERQAASLEQTAAALEQITATVRQNAENARRMREVATAAGQEVRTGGDVLKDTVVAMAKIERSSDEIARILGVIDEIAFQTNLLALNAGVEAARAGEAGRGFAVVATEVRALAQRSSEAAKEIKTLINTSAEDVGTGVRLVGRTASALEQISTRITDINGLVATLAMSAEEEARSVTEVNTAVSEMDQITQQNAAMVEQSTAACHSLASEARSLAEVIARFHVGEKANATGAPNGAMSAMRRAAA